MTEPVFCPQCRDEYLSTASVCAECGVPLVAENALADHAEAELPSVSELVCVRASSVGWAQALSARLAAAGISHRIEVTEDDSEDGSVRRPGVKLPFGVYVRAEDEEAAAAIDAEFTQSQIPDLPEGHAPTEDPESCPACGSGTQAGSSECPDCGLALL
jgi:hypothetical protein